MICNYEIMDEFLNENPDYLDDYVLNNVSTDQIERWLIRKNRNKKTSLSRYKFCVHADKRKMIQSLTNLLHDMPQKAQVLHELSSTIASAVNASSWNLFLYDYHLNDQEINTYENICRLSHHKTVDSTDLSLALHVSKFKKTVSCRIDEYDSRFPYGVPNAPQNASFAMALPIVQSDNALIGVLELYRKKGLPYFFEEDEEIANSYLVWGGVALHYAELYYNLSQQRKLNTFLLSVVRSIFQDMVNMDVVVSKILEYARNLVNADRASLFLIDYTSNQLYPFIFDANDNNEERALKKEIHFPIGSGIAGNVAKTGVPLNIANAYADSRFNRSIDQKTGYQTKSILCMPIFIRDKVIGVLQMVNKKVLDIFTKEDEESFAVFATYCGLALDHARLYEKIHKSQEKYKVALEVLSYHNTCTSDELQEIKSTPLDQLPDETDPDFTPYRLSSDEKVLSSVKLIQSFSGITKCDQDDIYRFALTVRKNYRKVPYHNWSHGYSVAQTIYIFTRQSENYSTLDKFSFFVSGLCHDLDHRGTNNQFLVNSSASLANLYSNSPLEYHHFNQAVSILQQNGMNILKCMSSEDYKLVLANIKHFILATDMAKFFTNLKKLQTIANNGSFDWNLEEHKILLSSLAMNGADLNSTALPWPEARAKTKELFEEFYAMGDSERQMGREPMALMDRLKIEEQPKTQVDFLENISIPCLQIVEKFLPDAHSYLKRSFENLDNWRQLHVEADQRHKRYQLTRMSAEDMESPIQMPKIGGIEKAKSFRL
ncbi:probable 3',5'-cyclic phosphodiesterase pde-5 [Oppia nitens]|uniref:probable 3',5'-cyclic phosphodiesterase pde-5 n=1 Tax=Oppia nitens TaxID=1686743 RepID=UPI0023D9D0E4|nr:probable 3',5'-cyclic phosphodiesterase pde-5 [Oppia nitens]